jgi:hypothetical protein
VAEQAQPADSAAAGEQTRPADAAAAVRRRDLQALEEAEVAGSAPSEAAIARRRIWAGWGFTSSAGMQAAGRARFRQMRGAGEGALVVSKDEAARV